MNWRLFQALCLTVSITALAFEGFSRRQLLLRPTFCDMFGGTWMGFFCDDAPAGGGGSGAGP